MMGGLPDDDDGELALEALAREGGDLGRVVEHHRDHRRVTVAQHLCWTHFKGVALMWTEYKGVGSGRPHHVRHVPQPHHLSEIPV